MAKIKDLPKFKRPREKLFEKGPDALKDHELLAILLRTGYQGKSALEVAKRILRTHKIDRLSKLSPDELAKIKGVGKSRAAIIAASLAISERIYNTKTDTKIETPNDVLKVASFLKDKKKEYLVALLLNGRDMLISTIEISVGTLTENLIHPREVFAPAIVNHSAKVVLVHNHPSGNSDPSEDDLVVTRRLLKASKILGIELKDHIIITNKDFFSFKDEGII